MMPSMTQIDVPHLSNLARITVTEEEAARLQGEIETVLEYVSTIDEITADSGITKQPGVVKNVFRADEVTTEADTHTETLLAEAPERKGRWLKVKKILTND